MGYHHVLLPANFSVGSRVGPRYRTLVVPTDNGTEYRTQRFSIPLYRYDIARNVQTDDDIADLLTFFHARQGATYAFLAWDDTDHSTEPDHQTAPAAASSIPTVGTGDAAETQYQLTKIYTDGTFSQSVPVTKPIPGTVVVLVNGTEKTEGSDYSVNYETGVITFALGSLPGIGDTVSAGCQYYRVVRFGEETDRWLNIEGEQGFSNARSIILEGVRDLLEGAEMAWMGGADQGALTGDVSIARGEGRFRAFDPDTAGHVVNLPDPSTLELGGPHFVIGNDSATNSLTVFDPIAAATVATVAAVSVAECHVRKNSAGNNEWVAF